TGHDAIMEANQNGKTGGPSVLVEALIGGLGALVILFFVLGTLPAVLLPIAIAVSSILNTFTLVWILTYITDVSIVVQFLIALVGLGVAIDYALLMIFRFRDELREGKDVETALVETMTHAGKAVIVSGSTVAVGLLSLIVLPLPFIRSIGIGGMLIPAVSVLTAITLLPALLAVLGERINSLRLLPKRLVDHGHPEDVAERLGHVDGITAAAAQNDWRKGDAAIVEAFPAVDGADPGIQAIIDRSKAALKGTNATVSGTAAVDRDLVHAIYGNFPY